MQESTQVSVQIFRLHKEGRGDFRFTIKFSAVVVMQSSVWCKKGLAGRMRAQSSTSVSSHIVFMS